MFIPDLPHQSLAHTHTHTHTQTHTHTHTHTELMHTHLYSLQINRVPKNVLSVSIQISVYFFLTHPLNFSETRFAITHSCQPKRSRKFSLSFIGNKVKIFITTFTAFSVLCSCNICLSWLYNTPTLCGAKRHHTCWKISLTHSASCIPPLMMQGKLSL